MLKKTIVCAAVLLFAAGCGKSGLTTIPVHGKVTFNGGPCPAAGTLTFLPLETPEGIPRRPAVGKFDDKDGRFEATSFQPGDGLLPGRYRVSIECVSGLPPLRPGGLQEVSYIAAGYEPGELAISTDSDAIEVNYDVPLKKK